MLILTRYAGQKIIIGDDVVLTILPNGSSSKQIKIGIECPTDIKIYREEIYKIKQEEKKAEEIKQKILNIRKKLWGEK